MSRWTDFAEWMFVLLVACDSFGVARGVAVAFTVHLLAPHPPRAR